MSEPPDPPDPSDDALPPAFDYATPTTRRSVSLAKIHNPIQAQFIATLLERAGISCVVLNPNSSAHGPALGYVPCELLVRPEDHDRAAEILNDLNAGRISLAVPDVPEDPSELPDDAGESPDPRCPKCSSWQVRVYVNLWQDFLRFLHLLSAPPDGATQYECLRCSHKWIEISNPGSPK